MVKQKFKLGDSWWSMGTRHKVIAKERNIILVQRRHLTAMSTHWEVWQVDKNKVIRGPHFETLPQAESTMQSLVAAQQITRPISTTDMINKKLKRRILELAYKHKLCHLGSYLSCVDIIATVYKVYMKDDDIFILSNGHAALAQYVVLEDRYGIDAEKLFLKHGGHPHRDEDNRIYCTTGSLGMGLSAAVGRALVNTNRHVHVIVSDGECAEGVVWEAFKFIQEQPITNISVYIVYNGYSAYGTTNEKTLARRIAGFQEGQLFIRYATSEQLPFLKGLDAHYHVMNEADYQVAREATQ